MSSNLLISRRALLQMAAGGAIASQIPPWMWEQAAVAAPSPGTPSGTLVVVYLAGGNDWMNTIIPIDDDRYRALRGSLAISRAQTLDMGRGWAMNARLAKTKRIWDRGEMAIVQGVQLPGNSLSHFDAIARLMAGHASGGNPGSGWLGRFLDGIPGSPPLSAITIGDSVPLLLRGNSTSAMALPQDMGYEVGANRSDATNNRMYDALDAFSHGAQLNDWCARVAANTSRAMQSAQLLAPVFGPATATGIAKDLEIAARLINSGIGVRVVNVTLNGFDTHSGQATPHAELLAQLDNGIDTFFATLDTAKALDTTMMVYSEFGRRPRTNGSAGTDHGTASDVWLLGTPVRGGFVGTTPSLTDFDDDGNFVGNVDFRSIVATVVEDCLAADANAIIGGSFPKLDVYGSFDPTRPGYWLAERDGKVTAFGARRNYGSPPRGSTIAAMAAHPSKAGYWLTAPNGAVFAYGAAPFLGGANGTALAAPIVDMTSCPFGSGYWLVAADGGVFAYGDAAFHGSTGDLHLNAPIVDITATASGNGYWMVAADGGVFSFGDAEFFGSTGGIRLNRPVVAMAPTPTGRGYWLVASDGGVFAFGDAEFFGSTGGITLNQPILDIIATPTGRGYWMVAADGGMFAFGDAAFLGSLANKGTAVVGMGA
ncbi:MAG: DUF1501 domain-containing protein [Acidimicrobiia bacterium]